MRVLSARHVLFGIAAAVVNSVFLAAANSANIDWNGSVSTDWNTGANWNGGVVPSGGTGNFAQFIIGAQRPAAITANVPDLQDYLFGNDTSAGIREVDQSAGTANALGWVRMGINTSVGDSGTYNLSGGTLNAGSFKLAENAGSITNFTVSGGTLFQTDVANPTDSNVWSQIGQNGATNFNISSGLASFDARLMIGSGSAWRPVVTQTGGILETRRGQIVIADSSTDARYNISGGTLRTVAVGVDPANATNTTQPDITVGQWDNSHGLLNVSGTATVRSARNISLGVGEATAPNEGTITQAGAGSNVTYAGQLYIGDQATGTGTYNLSGGNLRQDDRADLNDQAGWNFLGANAGSQANFNVTGGTASLTLARFLGETGISQERRPAEPSRFGAVNWTLPIPGRAPTASAAALFRR